MLRIYMYIYLIILSGLSKTIKIQNRNEYIEMNLNLNIFGRGIRYMRMVVITLDTRQTSKCQKI